MELNDKGTTAKQIKSAEALAKAYDKAAGLAAKVNAPLSDIPSGTTGSKKAAKAALTGSTGLTGQEYGNARGTAGVTGASARDFANQSQGLGGLVRLYATYAANIFAVGAAFRALSTAMDTTNMVRGLDQLGAASGMALGSLSKRLVTATDGAISLREAMEATAKATSSGMNSDQLLRMGKVAKTAAQSLGINMADAMSRITRAATKLEPELVDELGLFTRTGKAAEDYAKSIGKSVTQLTDFERRMSYANALIAEGEAKFSEINIDTNAYTKLAASIKDLTQSGLELVNSVLVPIVGFLAKSPTALATAIASLGVLLVKQAVPALGEVRKSYEASAQVAQDASRRRFADLKKAYTAERSLALQSLDAEAQMAADRFHASSDRVLAVQTAMTGKMAGVSKRAVEIAKKAASEVTEADIAWLKKRSEAVGKTGLPTSVAHLYKEQYASILESKKLEEEYSAKATELDKRREQALKSVNTETNTYRIYQRELASAQSKQIASDATYTGSIRGLSAGFRELNLEIAKARSGPTLRDVFDKDGKKITTETIPAMSRLGAATTFVAGTFGIVTGAIGTALNAFAPWLALIGLVTAAISMVISYFSTASKAVGEMNEAVTSSTMAIGTLNSVIDRLNKVSNVKTNFTASSINAQSKATLELASSMEILAEKSAKAQKDVLNGNFIADVIPQAFLAMFGKDVFSKFTKEATEEVRSLAKSFDKLPEPEKATQRLYNVLGISSLSELDAAMAKLTPNSSKFKELQKLAKDTGVSLGNIGEGMTKVSETAKKANESGKSLLDTYKVETPVTKFAADSITAILALDSEIRSGTLVTSMQSLSDAAQNIQKTPIYGQEASLYLAKYKDDIENINQSLKTHKNELVAATTARNRLLEKRSEYEKGYLTADKNGDTQGRRAFGQAISNIDTQIEFSNKSITTLEGVMQKAEVRAGEHLVKVQQIAAKGVTENIGKTIAELKLELAKGSTAVAQAAYSKFADVDPAAAAKLTQLKLQELGVLAEQIKAARENSVKLEGLTRILAVTSARDAVSAQKATLVAGGMTPDVADLTVASGALGKALARAIMEAELFKATSSKNPLAGLEAAKKISTSDPTLLSSEFLSSLDSLARGATGAAVQLNNLAQQAGVIKLEGRAQEAKAEGAKETELRNLGRDNGVGAELKLAENAYNALLNRSALLTEEERKRLVLAKRDLDIAKAKVDEANNTTKALADKKATMIFVGALEDGSLKNSRAQIAEAKYLEEVKNAGRAKAASVAAADETAAKSIYDIEVAKIDAENKLKQAKQETLNIEKDSFMLKKQSVLDLAEIVGTYTPEYLAQLKYEQELFKINEEAKRQEDKLTSDFIMANAKAAALYKYEITKSSGVETDASRAALADYENTNARFGAELAALDASTAAKLKNAAATKTMADSQNAFNATLETLKGLDTVFEGLGTKLSDVAAAFKTMTDEQLNNVTTVKELQEKYDAFSKDDNSTEKASAYTKLEKAKDSQTKSELSNLANVAGTTKKIFKEKTAAHKLLSGIEKAAHIAKVAMTVKEMAVKIFADTSTTTSAVGAEATKTGATIAGTMARIPAYITDIYGKTIGTLGPIAGPAVATALIAMMLAALGGGGNKGSSVGATAADRQETQGTGMAWQDGKKVDTDFGALGDNNAKVEDIANSIDYIEKYTLETSTFGYKSLKALNDIRDATRASAAEVAKSTSIFSAKSGFGTLEKSNSGFLGLFASSTNVIDKGIKVIADSLLDAASGKGSFDEYETIQKKNSGLFGLFGSNDVSDKTKALSQQAQEGIQSMFSNAAAALQLAATSLGATAKDSIDAAMKTFKVNLEVSGKDMTGEEFAAALEAGMNVEMNKVVANAMPWLNQFRQLGEGFTGTLLRVTTDFNVVVERLERLGVDFKAQIGNIPKISEGLNTALLNANTAVSNAITNLFTTAEETTRYFVSQSHWDQGGGETYGVKGTKTSAIGVNELAAAEAALAKVRKDLVTEFGSSIQGLVDAADSAQQALNKSIVAAIDAGATQEDLSSALAIAKGSTEEASSAIATSLVPAFQLLLNSQNALATVTTEQSVFNIAASERILKAFGGTEKAVALFDNFFDNFYSESEQKAAKTLQLNNRLKDIAKDSKGLISTQEVERLMAAGKNTRQEFRSLVLSLQTLSSGTGEAADAALNTYVALMGVASALVDVTETVAQATMTMEEFYKSTVFSSFASDGFKYQVSLAAVNKEFVRLGLVLPKTSSELFELVNTLSMRGDFESVSAISALSSDLQTIYKDSDSTSDAVKNLSTAFDNIKSSATAYYNVLKSTLSKYKDFAKSLREFSDSLKLGDLSPLTPAQKYLEAKSAFEKASASAASGDQDALAKLQSASSAFLQASRTMYASSSIYTNDYNAVQSALDIAISAAEAAASENEMLIAALEETHSFLKSNTESLDALRLAYEAAQAALTTATPEFNDEIVRNFGNIDRNLDGLLTVSELKKSGLASEDAIKSVYKLLDVDGNGTISLLEALRGSSEDSVYGLGQVHSVLLGVEGGVLTVAQAIEYLNKLTQANTEAGRSLREADSAIISTLILGMQNKGTAAANTPPPPLTPPPATTGLGGAAAGIPFVPPYWYGSTGSLDSSALNLATNVPLNTQYQHWDSFAVGTNFVPNDMFAEIHKGERIIPAADNARLMQVIEGNGVNNVNAALLAQIQELNKKVESLENTVREGAIVNAIATDRNTEEVAKAVKDTGSKAKFTETIKGRAAVK